ncbi:hypothetical protein AQ490_12495 [Wenjunlia vitaminophila]|uniref:EamA domain-containing protein n=1 Tax=Wenjunlia vitaminophila TaxID=76728 RepID=A0A0T6LL22_WENVI|nr:DMT family transporter [Wenjunlia vitaminophila]KRV46681.1 hypothetical protein AQ490_12495 [Wenjunlia vitaminophila]
MRRSEGRRRGTTPVPLLSVALVLLLAGTWLVSAALVEDTGPLTVAAGRTVVCAVVLAGFAATTAELRRQVRTVVRRPGRAVGLGLLGFGGYATGTLLAIPRIGASLTNLVVALLPCAAVLLGALLPDGRPTRRTVLGAGVATAAAVGYAADGGTPDGPGLMLAVAAMLGLACYGHLYRRALADVAPLAALPVLLGAASLALVPVALPEVLADPPTPAECGGVAVLGAVVYAPAYLVQHRLILLRGPVLTAAVQLAVPFAVRLGDWALGSAPAPSAAETALLACCCGGIALVTLERHPRPADGADAAAPPTDRPTSPEAGPRRPPPPERGDPTRESR